jgi:hypothetical protein
MKKTILSIAAVLMLGLSSFASATSNSGKNDKSLNDNGTINQVVVKSFNREFTNARNICWEQRKGGVVKVTFTMGEDVLFAYYNDNGDLRAIVRNILSDQLPINLLTDLKNEYGGFWISDLFEIASDDQTSYYVTIENADKTIVLKSEGTNGWNVYSKQRKDSAQ